MNSASRSRISLGSCARYLAAHFDSDSIADLDFETVVALREDLDQFRVQTVPAF
jgi:hypothetical protein